MTGESTWHRMAPELHKASNSLQFAAAYMEAGKPLEALPFMEHVQAELVQHLDLIREHVEALTRAALAPKPWEEEATE